MVAGIPCMVAYYRTTCPAWEGAAPASGGLIFGSQLLNLLQRLPRHGVALLLVLVVSVMNIAVLS